MKIVALILAKKDSRRLPNKNTLPVNGMPMFMVNVKKCLKLFKKVYVSSDSLEILETAMKAGAIPIKRSKELCGEMPNIPVYRHALGLMNGTEAIVAVQANSPTVSEEIIKQVAYLLKEGYDEVMTCHPDKIPYGSVWGLTKKKILSYRDALHPNPKKMILDLSIDVHTKQDYKKVLKFYE
jgi:CMP-N-acetylneuraminic acid synthetase